MDEAWKTAEANTPEGFVFVQGGRYKRFNTARRGEPKEEELFSFYMCEHEVTQEDYEL